MTDAWNRFKQQASILLIIPQGGAKYCLPPALMYQTVTWFPCGLQSFIHEPKNNLGYSLPGLPSRLSSFVKPLSPTLHKGVGGGKRNNRGYKAGGGGNFSAQRLQASPPPPWAQGPTAHLGFIYIWELVLLVFIHTEHQPQVAINHLI